MSGNGDGQGGLKTTCSTWIRAHIEGIAVFLRCKAIQHAAPSRVVGAFVRRIPAFLFLAVLCICSDALARNPRDVFDRFAGDPQLVVTKAAQAEWRKSPDAEITCIEQNHRRRGTRISALIEQGIPTFDRGAAPKRASCRNPMGHSILLTRPIRTQADPYSVDGLTLGSQVAYGTPAYQQYRCNPSQKFEGFIWCTKTVSDKEARGRFKAWFSILHAQNGAVVYASRFQERAYWSANEVADDIQGYSRKIGEEPHIIRLPVRPGLPEGTLATWGKVVLEPIAADELRLLAEGKSLKRGIAIDLIGNFTQSARQGLPIYRLGGGAGFVWAASYNESGRGTFRFSAVDASTYSPQSLPAATTLAAIDANPVGQAATAIEAQPTSPPAMASPPPVDGTAPPPYSGENLDCSATPDCGAPTRALSIVAPPRDPNEVIADDAGKYARESSTSNFRSPQHGRFDIVSTYWGWIISALIASGPAAYWSTRLPVARDRGVQSWQGWTALALAIGLVMAILLPGKVGIYIDALLFLSFLCIKGFLASAWLRRTGTHTQVAAMGVAEDARCATEVRVEEAPRGAEVKPAEDTRSAEVEAADEACRSAEVNAAEDARRVPEVRAANEERCAAEPKVAEIKAAEDTRRIADRRLLKKRARRRSQGRRGRTKCRSKPSSLTTARFQSL
jgi:hypothetical protein